MFLDEKQLPLPLQLLEICCDHTLSVNTRGFLVMFENGLDAKQLALLWRIYQGEKSFPAPSDKKDEAACRDYNFLIETLFSLRDRGYIDYKRLHILECRMISLCRYLSAIVDGLTYQGEKLARSLEPAPAARAVNKLISAEGLHSCRRDFERAVGSIESDPEQAIGSASSLLESIFHAILERAGRELPSDKSVQSLIKVTLDLLDLSPGSASESDIRGALRGLTSIAQAVGAMRTKAGAAHGRGLEHEPLAPRHARLVVNAAATVGLFLLETALERKD